MNKLQAIAESRLKELDADNKREVARQWLDANRYDADKERLRIIWEPIIEGMQIRIEYDWQLSNGEWSTTETRYRYFEIDEFHLIVELFREVCQNCENVRFP